MKSELVELIKKEFNHLGSVYFNTAYFGPSPYSAKHKIMKAVERELDPSFYAYDTWMGIPERIRKEIARLLDVSADNIMHSTATTDIINTVANGYDFQKGDIVCAIDKDYPSNVLPWMVCKERKGIDFRLLDLGDEDVPTAEWLEKQIPEGTKIFDMSYITFDTGKKMDILSIGKMLKKKDILFILDATQALGGMEITKEEFEVIDVLACSSYKWMLGPYGHAFAYFSDRAIELVHASTGNWVISPNSKTVYSLLDYTTEALPGARKYDRGQTANPLVMACLEASLDFFNEVTLPVVREHNEKVRDYFLANYPKSKYDVITPKKHMGNVVCLKSHGIDPIDLERELKFNNVDVSIRQGNVRLSFHIFNTEDQVDKLISALDI
jgi:cysteine desulfurase/selenocysteine lyase